MDTPDYKLEKTLIPTDRIPDNLLASLESREVALWVQSLPEDPAIHAALLTFLGLPWRLIISETYDEELAKALLAEATVNDPMTRKRGFVQILDSDPSRIELPPRCLPIYLLNGRRTDLASSDFDNRLRRMTMLEALRRSCPREILVLSSDVQLVPGDLKDLWSSGFKSYLSFTSDSVDAEKVLTEWLAATTGTARIRLLRFSVNKVIAEIVSRYAATYPEGRRVIRVRDVNGTYHKIDITETDDPERPIAGSYSIIEERHLTPLTPEELSEEEFVTFFRDPTESWRPYQAGLPWMRDPQCRVRSASYLKKLDTGGAEENCIAYIASEAGAGGTTLARALAWELAREGYPVLLAKQLPFVPDALQVANFMTRVHNAVELQAVKELDTPAGPQSRERDNGTRHYETPWLVVFDSLHWHYRETELARFRNEMERSGRPVCVIIVTGPATGLSFLGGAVFKKLIELNHAIDLTEARQLGAHLNQFLRPHGKQRETWQWDQFYQEHTVRYLEGVAAFWVTLSFWIQGQYDLSETIQEWMYRSFRQNARERTVQVAILRIAALSSERLPLPEILLPKSQGEWPISQILEDQRSSLAALGLVRISSEGEKYWALVHDVLGRFLINALFYDFSLREELGFAGAKDPDHLRFLLLRQISEEPALGEVVYRPIGEDFATSIFKIDPDHGHGGFVSMWREVLDALDQMPRSLRDTSRLFRHHTAVSRRRIAKLDERFYGVTNDERIALLNRAIEDINYALNYIDYTPKAESNLNLLNSLANAYFDLADAELLKHGATDHILELRRLANEATRRAYAENPTNSFVIETYVRNLLHTARDPSVEATELCVEALGILFSALTSNEAGYRASQLGNLADQALAILFQQTPSFANQASPTKAIDVLIQAWRTLAEGSHAPGMALSDVPEDNRARALGILALPAGRGNLQVIRLTYDLTCINRPYAFEEQLALVEQLQASSYRLSSQLRLEYAILLYQASRALEGEKVFRLLRRLWRESEQLVQVPDRLRWLRAVDRKNLLVVHAIIGSDYGTRAMAHVQEFGSALVPLRPEEHGFRSLRVGMRFSCHVSFGHNGPFLRPATAGPAVDPGGARG